MTRQTRAYVRLTTDLVNSSTARNGPQFPYDGQSHEPGEEVTTLNL
jgi:hypothetical protein